ncbi:MAG: NAD-dependent epimerase/dehydratase [Acidobacteria bacterium]|jgi:nucleoside-diphosphate-sugar epimerase|nr:NAD-dependent epimerase/dehydratase [Acidobacteriota bacterium]
MKRVLLTGASGYIGQFAIRPLLDKNYTVHGVTSKPFNLKTTENLFWHQTSLLNHNETEKLIENIRPTHLLHFAWYVEHGKFWNAVENLDWLQASLHLAKTFVENGGKRMVIAGTCAEYDWTVENPFVEYKTPFRSQTLYGASKNALSSTLETFAQAYDFSFASGKIFFPFGANESPNRLLPSVIRALLENKPAKTSHGNQIRDFLYVKEIAEAFVALLESDVRGAVNIASGKGIRLKKIVEEIAEIIGKPELLRIGALPSSQSEPSEIVADITRLREEVGWRKEYNLKKGLIKTVNYWKEKYENYD